MKKVFFGLIATVVFGNLSFGQEQRRINKTKAGFMAVGDILGGAACVGLGPYGVLWGGFAASCGAAVLWNDMFGRNSNPQSLTEPLVKNNPDKFFDEYALVGKLHNDLMIKYCNNDNKNNVFSKENKLSDYIKNEMLQSTEFNQSDDEKKKFIENLIVFDKAFEMMGNKESTSIIIDELGKINPFSTEEQSYFSQIINFNPNGDLTPEDTFQLVNKLENSVRESSKLEENSKTKLFYSLEILRYSYALWYENIQE